MARCCNARDDLVLALESLAVVDLALRGAAAHHLEHDIAPQALAARQINRGEVAGGDFLDDAVAGHLDGRRLLGRVEERPRGERAGALLGARFGHRLEEQVTRDAGERQVVLCTTFECSHRRQLAAVLGEYDAVEARLRPQHLCEVAQAHAGQRFIAEVDLHDHRIGGAFLDEARQGSRVRAGRGADLGARPMARDMMVQPLQAFGVAAHHQQHRTGCIGHTRRMGAFKEPQPSCGAAAGPVEKSHFFGAVVEIPGKGSPKTWKIETTASSRDPLSRVREHL